MKPWIKTNFHFLKTFAGFSADGSKKYIFVLFWFFFFLLVNIVFNMNFFIWNRSDHWHAHNQRLKIPMFFSNFLWKILSFKHQPQLFQWLCLAQANFFITRRSFLIIKQSSDEIQDHRNFYTLVSMGSLWNPIGSNEAPWDSMKKKFYCLGFLSKLKIILQKNHPSIKKFIRR